MDSAILWLFRKGEGKKLSSIITRHFAKKGWLDFNTGTGNQGQPSDLTELRRQKETGKATFAVVCKTKK